MYNNDLGHLLGGLFCMCLPCVSFSCSRPDDPEGWCKVVPPIGKARRRAMTKPKVKSKEEAIPDPFLNALW
jgi:hypothetical protein